MKQVKSITESLVEYIKEGVLVVTVNKRLAGKLTSYYEAGLISDGQLGWIAADVYPLDRWLKNLWSDYSLSVGERPLLSDSRSKSLFHKIVREDRKVGHLGISLGGVAKSAYKAMGEVNEYSIKIKGGVFVTEEVSSYLRWCGEYEKQVAKLNLLDPILIKDKVTVLIEGGLIKVPDKIVFAGFDELSPKFKKLVSILTDSGCGVIMKPDYLGDKNKLELPENIKGYSFKDQKEEVISVARSIRKIYKKGTKVGIIVPDMEQYKDIIMREFSAELNPKSVLIGEEREEKYDSFNISLGNPLSSEEIILAALDILYVDGRKQNVDSLVGLLSSPYVADRKEYEVLKDLDIVLRKNNYLKITLNKLEEKLLKVSGGELLKNKINSWIKFIEGHKGPVKLFPSQWSEKFSAFLSVIGWPTPDPGLTLTSNEYQALQSWKKVLEDFSTLDDILGKVSLASATSELREMASETLYQVETPDCEIEVMGMLESSGIYFDHIWIMGVHREALPLKPKANPFIPFYDQKDALVPHSSYEGTGLMGKTILRRIFSSGGEFTVTYPREIDGRPASVSPYFREVEIEVGGESGGKKLFDVLMDAAATEEMGDEPYIPIEKGELKNISKGTGVIKNHSACPFRSFALNRLRADSLDSPEPGLNAMDKGTVIHESLRRFWKDVGDSNGLHKLSEKGTLSGKIKNSVEGALKSVLPWSRGRYFKMEVERVSNLLEVWFEEELKRGEFTVKRVESSESVDLGGFTANVKIDRIDELPSGALAVIDYKTGVCSKNDWLSDRPKEPQMPIYSMTGDFDAVSFASLKIGNTKFIGSSRNDETLPGVRGFESDSRWTDQIEGAGTWDELRDSWKTTLENIGRDFISGNHDVNPKDILTNDSACKYCDVKPLCRVFEIYVEDSNRDLE